MNRKLLACVLLAAGVAAHAAETQSPEAAKKDAESAVRITESLEKDPWRADADADRQWLLSWVVETPDYMVKICDVLGPIPGDENVPNGRELLLQHMFGNVSWQIRHPGKTDLVALQAAAMESLLKVYAAFIAKDEKARIEYFDGLLEQQRKGTLAQHLAPLVNERCVDEKPGETSPEETKSREIGP
jgi:hypothetical protein